MRAPLMHGLFALLLTTGVALADQSFKGAWFSISYPDSFVAVPGVASTTGDGVDSARFRGPQGRVEFYVYSPQAGGSAQDLAADIRTEQQIETRQSESAARTAHWTSYAARDGSYLRSVEEVRTKDGLQARVFSIRYRSAADLAAFRDDYARFKASLQQYQD